MTYYDLIKQKLADTDRTIFPERWAVLTELLDELPATTNYDICPIDGAPTVEPDGVNFTNLHCSKCDWEIGIKVIQSHVDSMEQIKV